MESCGLLWKDDLKQSLAFWRAYDNRIALLFLVVHERNEGKASANEFPNGYVPFLCNGLQLVVDGFGEAEPDRLWLIIFIAHLSPCLAQ